MTIKIKLSIFENFSQHLDADCMTAKLINGGDVMIETLKKLEFAQLQNNI